MKKVEFSRNWSLINKFMLTVGALMSITGFYGVLFKNGPSILSNLTFIFQGLIFIILWYLNTKRHKFYLKFDKDIIDYVILEKKGTLPISTIKDIKINLFEVQIESLSGDKTLFDLGLVKDSDLKIIKGLFRELKETISSQNLVLEKE
jgi:hypothetical protein